MTNETTSYWSPWAEASWNISAEMLGPPPRDARRYEPPLSTMAKTIPWVASVVTVVPTVWFVMRFLEGGSLGAPAITMAVIVGGLSLVMFGPKMIFDREPKQRADAGLQLRLGQKGMVAMAVVSRVTHDRVATKVGYRDGTAIDEGSGTAHATFTTDDGEERTIDVVFTPTEPNLAEGDEVTVLYWHEDPAVWLPVFEMNDIEFRTRA